MVLGLRELLRIYVDHRIEVVRRRSDFRRRKREDRLHLVDGLMIALLDIDEVIGVIRSSDDSAAAKQRLMAVFDLSDIQANTSWTRRCAGLPASTGSNWSVTGRCGARSPS